MLVKYIIKVFLYLILAVMTLIRWLLMQILLERYAYSEISGTSILI